MCDPTPPNSLLLTYTIIMILVVAVGVDLSVVIAFARVQSILGVCVLLVLWLL